MDEFEKRPNDPLADIRRKLIGGEELSAEEQEVLQQADEKRKQEIEAVRARASKPTKEVERDAEKADYRHRKTLGDDYE